MDRDLEREIDRLMGTESRTSGTATPSASRAGGFLRGRRLLFALILAIAEVVAMIVVRPGAWLGVVAAALVLALATWAWLRLRRGVLKDVVGVVALAQAMVVAIPVAVGVSIGVGLIVGIGVLAALALVVVRAGRRRA